MKRLLSKEYFQNPDTLFLAKDLLGKFLVTQIQGKFCSGMIVETEAYLEESKLGLK
jgi:DNA-3-methyladenine glycosylase